MPVFQEKSPSRLTNLRSSIQAILLPHCGPINDARPRLGRHRSRGGDRLRPPFLLDGEPAALGIPPRRRRRPLLRPVRAVPPAAGAAAAASLRRLAHLQGQCERASHGQFAQSGNALKCTTDLPSMRLQIRWIFGNPLLSCTSAP